MKKRVLIAVVVFAIVTFLCACNSTKPDPSMNDNDTISNSSSGKTDTSVISEETDKQKEDAITETKAPFADLEENYLLKIPIYVITHWSIKYDFSKSGDNYYFDDFQFDENGRLISYAQVENDTGKKWNKYTLEYDESNNIINVYYDAAKSSYSTITELEYDENNNCIKQTTIKKEDPSDIRINTYSYDERDFQIGRTAETNETSSSEEFSYEINDQGRVIKQFQTDGVKKREDEFEYDESGRLIKETETKFDEDGNTKTIYESEFEYDSYGHILHVKINQTYDEQGDLSTGDRTFDYAVGGFFTIQAQDTDTLKSPQKWISFEENEEVPMPDSVLSDSCIQLNEHTGGQYKYLLTPGEFDTFSYDYLRKAYSQTGVLANTIQKNQNETLWKYLAVLSQILNYDVSETADGQFMICKNGASVAELRYEYMDGEYYLVVSFL